MNCSICKYWKYTNQTNEVFNAWAGPVVFKVGECIYNKTFKLTTEKYCCENYKN